MNRFVVKPDARLPLQSQGAYLTGNWPRKRKYRYSCFPIGYCIGEFDCL
jgi:hypothetical protein